MNREHDHDERGRARDREHEQQVRRVAPFVHETMRQRGLACEQSQLQLALQELSGAQLRQVEHAALALARGSDGREPMGLLAATRTLSASATREALAGAGIASNARVLFVVATAPATAPVFTRDVARLRSPRNETERERARESLLGLCGSAHSQAASEPEAEQALQPDAVREPDFVLQHTPAPAAALAATPVAHEGRAAEAAAQPALRAPRAAARDPRLKVKIYGRQAALTCEAAPVRSAAGEPAALSTVMIEGARTSGNEGGGFDWDSKIIFACAQRELPQLLAVLLGWQATANFSFHGGKAGKELLLAHQEHGLFVKLRDGAQTVAVPVSDPDRYALAMLTLNVMAHNDPTGDAHTVLAVCRDVMSSVARPA